jgi:type I restriction enzyme, S subunit
MLSPLPLPLAAAEGQVRSFSIGSHWLDEEDHRLDASYYAAGAFEALDTIAASKHPATSLGELCGTVWHPVQNQARSNFKRNYTVKEHGVPFAGSREMFFFPLHLKRYIPRSLPRLGDLLIPEGWLLVSRSGTVGNVIYVNERLTHCAITEDAIRIEPTQIEAGYLYAFLASRYGQAIAAKGMYGATVEHLEPKHLRSIPVPVPPSQARTAIHDKIVEAYRLRDHGNNLIDEATQRLYSLLGVSEFTEDDIEYIGGKARPRAFSISSSDLGSRLDASHHVPLARSAVHKLQRGYYPLIRLGAMVERVYVAPRFARIYVHADHGVPLMQSSHVPLMRVHDQRFISVQFTRGLDRWIIHPGWVLVTCSGTIGRVAVSTKKEDGWAASQHILRIVPKAGASDSGFVAAFLATDFGQHQISAKVYGGVVDELTAEDMADVWVPDVPVGEQLEIGRHVLQAYEFRDEANTLEDEAIAQVEALVRDRGPA